MSSIVTKNITPNMRTPTVATLKKRANIAIINTIITKMITCKAPLLKTADGRTYFP